MTPPPLGAAMTGPRAVVVALLALVAALAGGVAPAAAQSRADLRPPSIISPSAILVEPATQDIVYQRNADKRRAIASTTKLMTALVTLDRLSLDDVLVAAPYSPAPAESLLGIRAGQRITVRDALRALLIVSANDVANTLAVRVAGSRQAFVRLMNARAKQIGLTNTHFTNPIGLDSPPGNYSSASDLVKLALVLRENAFFRRTTDEASVAVEVGGQRRVLQNRNLLVREVPFVNGVKTGHTSQAGWVLVGSGTRNGVTVVSAVLGGGSEAVRMQDTLRLLRYGTRAYRVVAAVRKGQPLARASLKYRDGQEVELVASRTVRRTARVGERLTTRVVGAPTEVDGPLDQGARVGTILVRQRGRTVDRVALVTAKAVSAASTTERLADYLRRSGTLLALSAFLLCSLVLVLLRRRVTRGPTGHKEAEAA